MTTPDPMPPYDKYPYPAGDLRIEYASDLPEWDGTDDEARQLGEDSRAAEGWGWIVGAVVLLLVIVGMIGE